MKREEGVYWVKDDEGWRLALWECNEWYLFAIDHPFPEGEWYEIDERRVVREVKTPIVGHSPFDRYIDPLLDGNVNSEIDLGIEKVQELSGKPMGKVGDIIEWNNRGKIIHNLPENHIFLAKIAMVDEDRREYGVYAEYGQDVIPFDRCSIYRLTTEHNS